MTEQNVTELTGTSEMTRVQSALNGLLFRIPYGSRLYGTQTPTSDYDYKCLYLPQVKDILLGRKLTNFKARFTADGVAITDPGAKMPDNGYEMEFIAVQTFMKDWLVGQTYAVEMAYAVQHGFVEDSKGALADMMREMITDMAENWRSYAVSGMVGFAMKQTFDYVHRGQRLKEAQLFLDVLNELSGNVTLVKDRERLDSTVLLADNPEMTALEYAYKKGVETYPERFTMSRVKNGNREENAIGFAGRTYVESTPLSEMLANMNRMVKQYGARSNAAAEHTVDSKSLMHAVRVYQQVLELLGTGTVTFPRQNREQLLGIRELTTSSEEVVKLLVDLDNQVMEAQKLHPPKVEELKDDYDEWMFSSLLDLYSLRSHKR